MGLAKQYRKIKKRLFGRGKWKYDAFLLSFPKCGRTWLRFQIGRAIQQHFKLEVKNLTRVSEMADLHPAIPAINVTHENQPHRKRPEELGTDKRRFRGKKVIFMVRDPRDVLVSYYFHKSRREVERDFWFFQGKRRETHTPFKGTLSEFLNEDLGGFDTLLRYYNIWAENREVPEAFMVVRYEDMHKDPVGELRRVLDFLGLGEISDDEVKEAVTFSSFENMQAIEREKRIQVGRLRPGDKDDKDSFKVRRGKAGGYKDYLSPEEVAELNARMAATLTDLYGYEPNVRSQAPPQAD
jgi:hypothetical protein